MQYDIPGKPGSKANFKSRYQNLGVTQLPSSEVKKRDESTQSQ